jgi:hypothetical protein
VQRLTCCNATGELFGWGLRAGVAGACVAVLSVVCGLEGLGGDVIAGAGQACVWVCTDARARAGTADLPYWRHLSEVTFCAWRPSSVQRLTCSNATSELFG